MHKGADVAMSMFGNQQPVAKPFFFLNRVVKGEEKTMCIHRMPFLFDGVIEARAYMLGTVNAMKWKPNNVRDVVSQEMVHWLDNKIVDQDKLLDAYHNKEEGFQYISRNDWPPEQPHDVDIINGEEMNNSKTRMIDV